MSSKYENGEDERTHIPGWKVGSILAVLVVLIAIGYRYLRTPAGESMVSPEVAQINARPTTTASSGSQYSTTSMPLYENRKADVEITEDWCEPVTCGAVASHLIGGNTYRNDLWTEVQIDGGPEKGGYRYPVPPWGRWTELRWKAPTHVGKAYQWRLMPGRNPGVNTATLQYTVTPNPNPSPGQTVATR